MENEKKHVRLSDITSDEAKKKFSHAVARMDEVADAGGSPKAQLDAAKEVSGRKLHYKAHIGQRQIQRQLAKMEKNNGKE